MEFVKKYRKIRTKYPLLTLSSLILVFSLYTIFHPIPLEGDNTHTIGIGADILGIGDRYSYTYPAFGELNPAGELPGRTWKVAFLYPFILKSINSFVGIFELGTESFLWNLITISITSLLSILSLIFIQLTAFQIFGKEVAKLSGWLFILCPYTLFFALNGGLTMYIIFGVATCGYILSISQIFEYTESDLDPLKTILLIGLNSMYLSSLRPSGALFSIPILLLISFVYLNKKSRPNKITRLKYKIIKFSSLFFIIYSFLQLYFTTEYIVAAINAFSTESGTFFGVSRDLIRNQISSDNILSINGVKNLIYNLIWKATDFISGIHDIRDTHTNFTTSSNIFPFLARITTGLFYLLPISTLSLLGLIKYRKLVFNSGLCLVLIGALISISPSILGVANSRYLVMVYPPFIILSASMLANILAPLNSGISFD